MRGPTVFTEARVRGSGDAGGRGTGRPFFFERLGGSMARQNRATVVRETGTPVARNISVMTLYEARLCRSSAIPGCKATSLCHFGGTGGE